MQGQLYQYVYMRLSIETNLGILLEKNIKLTKSKFHGLWGRHPIHHVQRESLLWNWYLHSIWIYDPLMLYLCGWTLKRVSSEQPSCMYVYIWNFVLPWGWSENIPIMLLGLFTKTKRCILFNIPYKWCLNFCDSLMRNWFVIKSNIFNFMYVRAGDLDKEGSGNE